MYIYIYVFLLPVCYLEIPDFCLYMYIYMCFFYHFVTLKSQLSDRIKKSCEPAQVIIIEKHVLLIYPL